MSRDTIQTDKPVSARFVSDAEAEWYAKSPNAVDHDTLMEGVQKLLATRAALLEAICNRHNDHQIGVERKTLLGRCADPLCALAAQIRKGE